MPGTERAGIMSGKEYLHIKFDLNEKEQNEDPLFLHALGQCTPFPEILR
jgi:hypothetical protein